jgi:UDPglucose 6-dehydrogenase
MPHYNVGICGVGFVGNAVWQYLKLFSELQVTVKVYDKYKESAINNNINAILDTDILFLCLPTPYSSSLQTYDLTELNATLEFLNQHDYQGVILLKSTVLPDFCATINNLYTTLKLVHNPEFLSCTTAVEDFAQQTHIVLGFTEHSHNAVTYVREFYTLLFPLAVLSVTSSTCASLMKMGCNNFYALKVQFFSELYLLCEQLDISFNEVKTLMLNNGWIHSRHTEVPGPDQNISFGGACFPKDMAALTAYMQTIGVPHAVLLATLNERNDMRKD